MLHQLELKNNPIYRFKDFLIFELNFVLYYEYKNSILENEHKYLLCYNMSLYKVLNMFLKLFFLFLIFL